MLEDIRTLAPSLVGCSVEYRLGTDSLAVSTDMNIKVMKGKIEKTLSLAFSLGGKYCVALLAECYAYYKSTPYFISVKGSLALRRYRPLVIEYLEKSADEREKSLLELLSKTKKYTDMRDAVVEAIRYFTSIYTGRVRNFKGHLTKEEYIIVA